MIMDRNERLRWITSLTPSTLLSNNERVYETWGTLRNCYVILLCHILTAWDLWGITLLWTPPDM